MYLRLKVEECGFSEIYIFDVLKKYFKGWTRSTLMEFDLLYSDGIVLYKESYHFSVISIPCDVEKINEQKCWKISGES